MEPTATGLSHRIVRMTGRDPQQPHRPATPLELLYDLVFVVLFGIVGEQAAHLLTEGHLSPAILGFAFAMFSACWAWINFSWFASAYDTDDWFFRIAVLIQMIGVVTMALGVPPLFHSLDEGHRPDNGVIVAGYVVMRVALVALWLRAARHDPQRRSTCLTYAVSIGITQIGWVLLIFLDVPLVPTLALALVLLLIACELTGPYIAERRRGETPWHAHHIAERYGLLVIIALGECVVGSVASISGAVESQGWSVEAALVGFAGIALTFALWWVYFILPSGRVLNRFRRRAFVWGYGHLPLFMSIAATGAGLHVAAVVVEGEAHIGPVAALATVVIPVFVFLTALFTLYSFLVRGFDTFHVLLYAGAVLVLAAALLAVAAGASFGVGILITVAAPVIVVVGYEMLGYQHQDAILRAQL